LTALHAILGSGTALAPLLLAAFVRLGSWWADPLAIGGFFLSLAFTSLPLSLTGVSDAKGRPPAGVLAILHGLPQRLYGYTLIALLYGICETIFGNWATIYLHEGKGLSPQEAGFALATFWAMVTVGRLLVAALSARHSPHRIYLAMPILILGVFLVIPMVGGATGNVVAFGLAGLACSAFLPLSISFATQEFSEMAEVVSGGMMAAFMLGYGLGGYGVGPLLEVGGLTLSAIYRGASLFAAGMALVSFLLVRDMGRMGVTA
jgi:predicted MFS family arabinose efflux permease